MSRKVYLKIEYDNIFIYEDVTNKEHLISFIHEIVNESFIKQSGFKNDEVYKNIKIELFIHYNNLILSVNLNL